MNKTQVAILDDHELFRTGIGELLHKSPDFEMVCSVGSPEELYAFVAQQVPDLLLLDIRLKNANGLDVLKTIKADYAQLKVVMLTMFSESSYVRHMIEQGANGYLLKDITPDELFRSLRNVVQLGTYFGPEVTSVLIQSLQHKETMKRSGLTFSDAELEVLAMISEGHTAEEIAVKLYKSNRTIEGYRQKLLDKTGSKNIAVFISWAYKNGVL